MEDAHQILAAVYDPEVISDFISLQLRLQFHNLLPVLQINHPQNGQALVLLHLEHILCDVEYALGCFLAGNVGFHFLHGVQFHDAGEEGRVLSHPIVLDVVV